VALYERALSVYPDTAFHLSHPVGAT
jgi:hypothetical protein